MIAPSLIEISHINIRFYKGDEEDQKNYHIEVNCLLDFNGVEVVTQFSVNLDQIAKMELNIPPEFHCSIYRDNDRIGDTSFNAFAILYGK